MSLTLNYLDQTTAVTDAAGTRNFTCNAQKQLASETNPSILNGGTSYSYDAYGRRTAMSFGNGTTTFANAAYTYDAMGRIATVGNSADTLTYTYAPGTGRVVSSAWDTATVNTAYTYDQYKRLTGIAVNNTSVYGYTLNAKNQRTGATLPDGNTWNYSYDALGQLNLAQKFTSTSNLLGTHAFSYDQIGNRTSATENSTTTAYTSNLVNQYTQIASQIPTYDADGNMLTNGAWAYTWNGENRMIKAKNATTGVRIEADYDYMGRRLFKKVYNNNTQTKHVKFAYDGYKLIAEFDALNSDSQVASYLWQPVGLDVPLTRTANGTTEYYIVDGNKNVIELRIAAGTVTTSYAYNPFGALESPTIGDENPFKFSSEYHDDETELVYYNYRYYTPILGRWINRDPIEEQGGVNLYAMCSNDVVKRFDQLGTRTEKNTVKVFSLGAKRLSGKYSDYTIKIDTAYIDASTRDNLGSTIRRITSSLPREISILNGGKISANGYLGSGFIAEAVRKNRTNCSRWMQYIWRNDNSLGPYSKGPYLELDYAFPAGAKAVDFPGDIYSGNYDNEVYQKIQLHLIDVTSGEVMHTIYWSNHIVVKTTDSLTPNVRVTLSVVW